MTRPGRNGETTSTRQPSPRPPSATMLLHPAESSACDTPDARSSAARAIQRVALADGAEVQLDSRTAEGHRRRLAAHTHRVESHPPPRLLDYSADGTRASRRRKPQHRLSGVVVRSKAPSVSRYTRWQSVSSSARSDGITTGPQAAWPFTSEIALVGMNTLNVALEAVDFIERADRGRDECPIRRGERHLEAAGHGAAMDADPVRGFRQPLVRLGTSRRERGEELPAIPDGTLVQPAPGRSRSGHVET